LGLGTLTNGQSRCNVQIVHIGNSGGSMVKVEATAARNAFSDILNKVAYGRDRVVIERRGKVVAALVPVEDLRLLELLEDRLDVEAARKALANPKNRVRVPWEKVKASLGL
jgi:prevent-host-death family protein